MANYEETHQMYHACDRVVCAPKGVLQDRGFLREKGLPHKKGYHVDSPSSGMSASDKVGGVGGVGSVGGVGGVSGGVLVQKGVPPFSVSSPREFGLMEHPSSGSLNSTSNVSANNSTHIFNCVNYVSNSNLNVRKFLLNDSTPTSVNDCQQNISYYNTFNTNCFLSASKTYFCNHFLHDCPLPPFPFIDAYNSPPSVTYVPSGALHCPGGSRGQHAQGGARCVKEAHVCFYVCVCVYAYFYVCDYAYAYSYFFCSFSDPPCRQLERGHRTAAKKRGGEKPAWLWPKRWQKNPPAEEIRLPQQGQLPIAHRVFWEHF